MIEGTRLGVEHMSTSNGGRGGTIINVASMGGETMSDLKNGPTVIVYDIFEAISFEMPIKIEK